VAADPDMKPKIARLQEYRQLLRLCGRLVATNPWPFVWFLCFTLVSAVTEGFGVGLLIPLLQQGSDFGTGGRVPLLDAMLHGLLPASPHDRVVVLAALLAVVILSRGLLQVVTSFFSITLPIQVALRLTRENYQSALGVGLDFFTRADGGILRTLVQDYPQRVASSIKSVTDIISNVILVAIYTAIMLALSWTMTLSSIALVTLAALGFKSLITMPLARVGEALSMWQERWNTLMYETSLGLKLIRLLGAESAMRRSYESMTRNYYRHETVRSLIAEAQAPLMTTIGGLFVCGMLIYGSWSGAGLDTAELLVLVLCLYRLTTPASRALTALAVIDSNLDALQRQEAFARSALAAVEGDGTRRFKSLRDGIRFVGVTFTHTDSDHAAVRDLNLTIKRGEMIALVGPSGAGKSTTVNLLGRLYNPQRGRIEIDGVDLRDYEIASWRRRISIVTQDITLFNMSVADNLTFGLEGVSRPQLEQAAARAAASTFINDLPQGWDTRLGDRGARLSGGQQQRLSIARAILRDPELLILDEATNQLDGITEQTIQRLIDSFSGNRTIVVVAHRLSTVRRADRIAVMRDGQVVELGTHNELVSRSSHYRTMLEAQQLDLVAETGT